VTNTGSDTVSVIDNATNVVVGSATPVGKQPAGIAFIPSGKRAFVVNSLSFTVSVIDTATNAVIATIPVGAQPYCVAITPNGKHAYMANVVSNAVSVIDTATNAVVATVPVGAPVVVAITPNGEYLYVSTNANRSQLSKRLQTRWWEPDSRGSVFMGDGDHAGRETCLRRESFVERCIDDRRGDAHGGGHCAGRQRSIWSGNWVAALITRKAASVGACVWTS